MLSFLEEVWKFFQEYILPVLPFLAIVLIEMQLMYKRRENDVMFGTDAFNEKIKAFDFSPMEVETLGELVRSSKFENKDAVLNSSLLFETAVNEYYRVYNVNSHSGKMLETQQAIASLRQKMGFTGANPLSMVSSTRQFNVGDRVDLEFENGLVFRRTPILKRSEQTWSVQLDGPHKNVKSGMRVFIRWTRMNDAVYSTKLVVEDVKPGMVEFRHAEKLEKEQLRKWVREVVDFPVTATFPNGEVHSGMLYDLSAGGILLGLAEDCKPDQQFSISFELPTFGVQNVDVKVLNNLGHRNPKFPMYFSIAAVFTGSYAWTQERVLQYIFEVNHKAKSKKMESKAITT